MKLSGTVWLVVLVVLASLVGLPAQAQKMGRGSLFSDYKAFQVGDIITIYIVEVSTGSNETKSGTKKATEISLQSDGGTGALNFIPLFGAKVGKSTTFDGKGGTSSKGVLKAKMSARIVQVQPNGNLVIRGTREVQVNNEKQLIEISGVVRPEDITTDNIVYSYSIADAKITYRGKGTITNGSKPSFVTRILNWVF